MEAKLLFFPIIVLVIVGILGFCFWNNSLYFMFSGYCLQILGMIFAIRGVFKIRRYFNQPSIKELLSVWIHRFPRFKIHSVTSTINLKSKLKVSEGIQVETWTSDNPEAPIKERFEKTLENINRLKRIQREQTNQINELENKHESFSNDQENKLKKQKKEIYTKLKESHINGIFISLFGLLFIVTGILMTFLAEILK
jgi:ABC-type antimicrobial peptide transport system permease subunit